MKGDQAVVLTYEPLSRLDAERALLGTVHAMVEPELLREPLGNGHVGVAGMRAGVVRDHLTHVNNLFVRIGSPVAALRRGYRP